MVLFRVISCKAKYNTFIFASLMAESRFNLLPCRGTYFQLADYTALSPHLAALDDMTFARRLHH